MAEKGRENSMHRALAWRSEHKNPCPDRCLRAGGRVHSRTWKRPTSHLHPPCWISCPLLTDKGYDANSLRNLLAASRAEAVIPSTKSRKTPIPYDKQAYTNRNLIEHTFGRLKDWRRIATRYGKLASNFASTVAIAAIILWWT